MKKTIMALLVLLLSFSAVFAVQTATLNLTTTITGVTNVAVIKSDSVPKSFPAASAIIGEKKQDVTSTAVKYAFVVETNQNLAAVTVQANPLKSGDSYITYTVGTDNGVSVATTTAGAAVQLMPGSLNTTGKRVEGGVFTVQGVATTSASDVANGVFGLDNAPAGTYAGSVTISYTAN
jgi:hypothetical protein